MKPKFIQIVTVEGMGGFPIDMLRYDGFWPNSEEDSGKIQRSLHLGAEDVGSVKVRRYIEVKTDGPTVGRWESFLWKVRNIELIPLIR